MDCNDYSYAPGMLDEKERIFAEFEDFSNFGYLTLKLEQWGSDNNNLMFVVSGFCSVNGIWEDVSESFTADNSGQWETLKESYAEAAAFYNNIVPKSKAIPLF